MIDGASGPLSRVAFWFLRHGETDWNAQGLSQGNIDIPLNDRGLSQAREAGALLRNRGIATILASPLSRAKVTAEIVGEGLGLPVAINRNLREVEFGVQEGKPMTQWFTDWVSGAWTPEGAESFPALRRRTLLAINESVSNPPVVLVVAHGAVFRALRAEMGIMPNMRTRNATPILCEPPAAEGDAWSIRYATADGLIPVG